MFSTFLNPIKESNQIIESKNRIKESNQRIETKNRNKESNQRIETKNRIKESNQRIESKNLAYSACRTGDRKQAKANRQTSHRGTNYRIILQLWLSKTVLESHDGTYWTRCRYSASRKGDRKETKSYTIHIRWLFERVQRVTTLICRFEFQTPFC